MLVLFLTFQKTSANGCWFEYRHSEMSLQQLVSYFIKYQREWEFQEWEKISRCEGEFLPVLVFDLIQSSWVWESVLTEF